MASQKKESIRDFLTIGDSLADRTGNMSIWLKGHKIYAGTTKKI